MRLTSKEFDRIAGLSMLEFSAQEKANLLEDLNKLLEEAEKLKNIDISDELSLVNPSTSYESGELRGDNAHNPLPQRIVLENAPVKKNSFIVVKKKAYTK
ncbi:MAG: Asp-tRNA(Asn)/Glu-tRNA(Gln) amidotransferase subunit GatC [Bacteroidales bacterium]|nr:Asp-tRNA(Asn)/Glu-tRNA(Gln) amidotransferase subunit GatC [Bacteroidales bacterium]MCF8333779.1 Asp-tRNA(Asn)/Glu-tRNA(Gln) amidotransferase subunit GatC [Bacteroidales bacterium]